MPANGKVTETRVGENIVVTDEAGESYTFVARHKRPMLLELDPRIDLTKPIYEQVAQLALLDKAEEEGSASRLQQDRVA